MREGSGSVPSRITHHASPGHAQRLTPNASTMSLARQLAGYAHGLRFADLGEPAVREVKRRVLDSIGCALGAYDSDVARISRRVAVGAPAERGATIWG